MFCAPSQGLSPSPRHVLHHGHVLSPFGSTQPRLHLGMSPRLGPAGCWAAIQPTAKDGPNSCGVGFPVSPPARNPPLLLLHFGVAGGLSWRWGRSRGGSWQPVASQIHQTGDVSPEHVHPGSVQLRDVSHSPPFPTLVTEGCPQVPPV